MRLHWRVIAAASACTLVLACREASTHVVFSTPGRSPAALITSTGERHVVYVDPVTQRLMHRRLDAAGPTAISPAGDAVDLRGENARVADLAHARWSAPVTLAAGGTSRRYVRRGAEALLSSTMDGGPRVHAIDPLPEVAP